MRTCFSSTSFSTPSAENAFLIARFKRKTGGFFTSIPTLSFEISRGRSSVLKNSSVSAAIRESLLRLPVASPARFRSGIISLRIKFRVLSFSKLLSSTTYGTSYFFLEVEYFFLRHVKERTDVSARFLLHARKPFYARAADYTHQYRFRLIVLVMSEKYLVAIAVDKQFWKTPYLKTLAASSSVSPCSFARRNESTLNVRHSMPCERAKSATNLLSFSDDCPLIPCSILTMKNEKSVDFSLR